MPVAFHIIGLRGLGSARTSYGRAKGKGDIRVRSRCLDSQVVPVSAAPMPHNCWLDGQSVEQVWEPAKDAAKERAHPCETRLLVQHQLESSRRLFTRCTIVVSTLIDLGCPDVFATEEPSLAAILRQGCLQHCYRVVALLPILVGQALTVSHHHTVQLLHPV